MASPTGMSVRHPVAEEASGVGVGVGLHRLVASQ